MKKDFNHIDDLFKDGLKNVTEVPSPGLWKKISGKLFWKDIARLNFGNIPKLWFGTGAVILVIATLLFWLPYGQTDDQVKSQKNDAGQISAETTGEHSLTQSPNNSDNNPSLPPSGLSIVTSRPDEADITGLPESIKHHPGEVVNQDPQGQQSLTPDQTIHEIGIASDESAGSSTTGIDASSPSTKHAGKTNQDAGSKLAEPETISPSESGMERDTSPSADPAIPKQLSSAKGTKINMETTGEIKFSGESNTLANGSKGIRKPTESPLDIRTLSPKKWPNGGKTGMDFNPSERNYNGSLTTDRSGPEPYFSVSAYFAPELTEYYRIASESSERSNAAGLALAWHRSRYVIQAGLEYSVVEDLGDFMVNLNSYDSIGYYNGISEFEIVPGYYGEDSLVYHYHTVEVRDTLQHHSHQQTRNNYTYLQFPVMFGYQAMQSGFFSVYLKAGPGFSFLLNRREQSLNFQAGETARITGIDNYTAPRLQTNIQVLVSLALQFQFSQRLGLLIEPTYRYYLNPVYDVNGESLKKPYGVGIRGGIFFNFQQKK
jgi:hypothetical protein